MIRIQRHRESEGQKTPLGEVPISNPLGALHHLTAIELPLGAQISLKGGNHHHTKIMVRTPLANGADISVYRGSMESMKILHDLQFFLQFNGFRKTQNEKGEYVFDDARMEHISPEIVHLLEDESPHKTSVATLLACGVTCPKEITAHHTRSVADIIGAVELMRDGHITSLGEVLAA